MSSPRPWGCFCFRLNFQPDDLVFPTPVGVFPPPAGGGGLGWGLPHARGGVSQVHQVFQLDFESSPRPWGCFPEWADLPGAKEVFPTPVGVFPAIRSGASCVRSLPHARGGVS